MRITAAVMERSDGKLTKRKIELQEVELDRPQAHEVLVRITSCGVCGTDRGCIHGLEPYPTPGVLGHEGAGVVEEVGPQVTLVAPGEPRRRDGRTAERRDHHHRHRHQRRAPPPRARARCHAHPRAGREGRA